MPEMDAPRALVFLPLVKGNEALGTRLYIDGLNAACFQCSPSIAPSLFFFSVRPCTNLNASRFYTKRLSALDVKVV